MRSLLRKLTAPLVEASRLYRWPLAPPYNYTSEPRKSVAEMRREMRAWKKKYGSYSFDYFIVGADIQGRSVDGFIPYELFKAYRDASNDTLRGRNDFNYTCLLEDKLVFHHFAQGLGHRTPRVYASLDPDSFEPLAERRTRPPDAFADVFRNTEGVLKPVAGIQGKGVQLLEVDDDTIYLDGEPTSAADLFSRLGSKHLYQKRIIQHPDLARLNPSSVNTLRVTTVWENGEATVIGAYLRVGAGGACVDNTRGGGLFIAIDTERGVLTGKGASKQGQPMVDAHPDTGVLFEGYPLPFFKESLDACTAFHHDLYGIHSVGWDVAVTPDGPTLIEGNARWGGYGPMVVDPKFLERYLASLGPLPPSPHRHRSVQVVDL